MKEYLLELWSKVLFFLFKNNNICNLEYIPKRLQNHKCRRLINSFSVGDILYRRCKVEELEDPFKSITLTDLSHNLGFTNNCFISNKEDVLFSIREDENFEKYIDKAVCALNIVNLNTENQYDKFFTQEKNGVKIIVRMQLIHDPVPCMYPHCIFRIWYDNQIVTFENYNVTLKNVNRIRDEIRQELAKMIIRKEISQKNI
jgi:hypothetical protein